MKHVHWYPKRMPKRVHIYRARWIATGFDAQLFISLTKAAMNPSYFEWS